MLAKLFRYMGPFALAPALIFFSSFAIAQSYEINAKHWDHPFIVFDQSTQESVLFGKKRWEDVAGYASTSKLRQHGRPIGRIRYRINNDKMGLCTGFLVAPNTIMTNHHCFPGGNKYLEAWIDFGAVLETQGYDSYRIDPDPIVGDQRLDFALLSIQGQAHEKWGTVTLRRASLNQGDSLRIYHHPLGRPQKISRVGCRKGPPLQDPIEHFLHQCDTLGGSSGSPILDDDGYVVGLHHSGSGDPSEFAYNRGTLMTSIIQMLPANISARIRQVGGIASTADIPLITGNGTEPSVPAISNNNASALLPEMPSSRQEYKNRFYPPVNGRFGPNNSYFTVVLETSSVQEMKDKVREIYSDYPDVVAIGLPADSVGNYAVVLADGVSKSEAQLAKEIATKLGITDDAFVDRYH